MRTSPYRSGEDRAANELTSAASVNYTYDGDGLRVEKSNGTLYWRAYTGQVLEETDTSGNLQRAYIFFDKRRIAWRDPQGVYYYLTDANGSTRVVADSSGNVCFDADYYPYGQEIDYTDSCSPKYKFAGYEYDSETGNYYAYARYYDPRVGRFLSSDPMGGSIGDPQSLNRYSYVLNNPENLLDPSGACTPGYSGSMTSTGNTLHMTDNYCPPPPPTPIIDELMGDDPCGTYFSVYCADEAGGSGFGGGGGGTGPVSVPAPHVSGPSFPAFPSDLLNLHCVGLARVLGPGLFTKTGQRGGSFHTYVTSGTIAIAPLQFFPEDTFMEAKKEMQEKDVRNSIHGYVVDPNTGMVHTFNRVSDVIGNSKVPHGFKSVRAFLESKNPGIMLLELEGVPPSGSNTWDVTFSESPSGNCPTGTINTNAPLP